MKRDKIRVALVPAGLFLIAQFIYQVILGGPYNLGLSLLMGAIIVTGSTVGLRMTNRRKRNIPGGLH